MDVALRWRGVTVTTSVVVVVILIDIKKSINIFSSLMNVKNVGP